MVGDAGGLRVARSIGVSGALDDAPLENSLSAVCSMGTSCPGGMTEIGAAKGIRKLLQTDCANGQFSASVTRLRFCFAAAALAKSDIATG